MNLINSTYNTLEFSFIYQKKKKTDNTLEQLENYKNETIHFEQQRAMTQVFSIRSVFEFHIVVLLILNLILVFIIVIF